MIALLAAFASAADLHHLGHQAELPPGAAVYTAGRLVNVRAGFATDAPITRRLTAGTRVTVVEQVGDRVEVRFGGQQGWIARELLTTMGRTVDLDQDGVIERVVVALDAEGRSVAWLREGTHVQELVIFPQADPYLGDWELVSAEEAGVPLLRVALGQDACGPLPTSWLSYQDGQLREALGVVEYVDGMYATTFEVRFLEPGRVSVRGEEREDGELLAESERACELRAGVFACS